MQSILGEDGIPFQMMSLLKMFSRGGPGGSQTNEKKLLRLINGRSKAAKEHLTLSVWTKADGRVHVQDLGLEESAAI